MVTNDILETMEPVKASSKQYMESPEVEAVAKAIIKNHNLDFGPADIVYFLVYPNISKKKAAQAIKCSDLVRFYSGNDFAVKVSGELWDMLDSKTKELMQLLTVKMQSGSSVFANQATPITMKLMISMEMNSIKPYKLP